MQPVNVNIDVKAKDLPTLICSDYSQRNQLTAYITDMARSAAASLGVEEYLFQPQRIDELRRRLWQLNPSL